MMPHLKNKENFSYRVYKYAWSGLDLLFPPHCGGCDGPGSRWCKKCQKSVKILPASVCECCGRSKKFFNICSDCERIEPSFKALRSWAYYQGPLRKAIHKLKYNGDITLGEILARPMIEIVEKLNWSLDLIVPVPMDKKRLSMRGYNHAVLLARPISYALGCNFSTNSLHKIRHTTTQVGLSVSERMSNISGAFSADHDRVLNKIILIVDDVVTTGATMEACSKALHKAGAADVFGVTLARTKFASNL